MTKQPQPNPKAKTPEDETLQRLSDYFESLDSTDDLLEFLEVLPPELIAEEEDAELSETETPK